MSSSVPEGGRRIRNRRLVDYMQSKSSQDANTRVAEKKAVSEEAKKPESSVSGEGDIDEIREILLRKSREAKGGREATEGSPSQSPAEASSSRVTVDATSTSRIIESIVSSKSVKIIECNQHGVCMDGKRIGEIFVDEYGIKRQRGYVNTTRLPIFLDFAVEEAEVKPVLKKALIVRTEKGSLALVPEDFICELSSRYGILLSIEKCNESKNKNMSLKGIASKRGRSS
ncbi:MAG: hypothetical protein OWQ48_05605 [Desulfurococcus sp.]|nr:hypothetical protein [Desulfurococcus sp.]